MRNSFIGAATLLAMASPVLAQTPPPARANAERCLRDHAEAAIAAGAGAADSAAFLVTYLCAGPVHAAGLHERNTATLERLRSVIGSDADSAEAISSLLIDPTSGELSIKAAKDETEAAGAMMAVGMLGGMGLFGGGAGGAEAPVWVRELAGELITEGRRR